MSSKQNSFLHSILVITLPSGCHQLRLALFSIITPHLSFLFLGLLGREDFEKSFDKREVIFVRVRMTV